MRAAFVSSVPRSSRSLRTALLLLATIFTTACTLSVAVAPALRSSADMIPLTDLDGREYFGFAGGLYPGGNDPPPAHAAQGLATAKAIQPLDSAGRPSPTGVYVLLSIGMSNAAQEFCSPRRAGPCDPWSFMGQVAAEPGLKKPGLVILNGAGPRQNAGLWDDPADANYERIRQTILAPEGLSERQVQIVWVKMANSHPTHSLPGDQSDAVTLLRQLGDIVRTLRLRYPNLRQVFVSSRIYAGYSRTPLNPEPYAYESGFAVKWLIRAQIDQMAARGRIRDLRAGDLNYRTVSPWIAWGPYLWANGSTPRSDALSWTREDFAEDGTHPSTSGERKVGRLLMAFFTRSRFTSCWFVAGERC